MFCLILYQYCSLNMKLIYVFHLLIILTLFSLLFLTVLYLFLLRFFQFNLLNYFSFILNYQLNFKFMINSIKFKLVIYLSIPFLALIHFLFFNSVKVNFINLYIYSLIHLLSSLINFIILSFY